MKKIRGYTISLGCPKNLVDTEKFLGKIKDYYIPCDNPEHADVIIINTCAFIKEAVEEAIDTILQTTVSLKNKQKPPYVIVTGCLVERYKKELEKEIPEVDCFVQIKDQDKIPQIIKERFSLDCHISSLQRLFSTPASYGYLKIAEGCDHKCSFCIIPNLRGRFRSYPEDQLVKEAQSILDSGRKELIVVAQDVTSYGIDIGAQHRFFSLLKKLVHLKGLFWLRLLYLYPQGVTEDLLKFLKDISPPFIPYFDIPFQHSHPDILKRMGRPFKTNGLKLIEKIKKYFPDAVFRTSIIVGFPGEEEKHFCNLIEFVKKARFHHMGVFEYSNEEESRAYRFSNQVPDHIKRERKEILMEIQKEISREYLKDFVDKELTLLVDKKSDEWPTLYEARAWFQAPEVDGKTYVSAQDIKPGDVIKAEVIEAYNYDLSAIL